MISLLAVALLQTIQPTAPAPRTSYNFDQPVILFETGDATVSLSDHERLVDIVRQLPASTKVTLVAQTDRVGSVKFNRTLAEQRAQSVARVLVQAGLSSEAIVTETRGERLLPVPTDDGVPEKFNRRVVLLIVL